MKFRGKGERLPSAVAVSPGPRFGRLGESGTTALAKQGVQVRQVVAAMEGMEMRLVELLRAEMKTTREEMKEHLAAVDQRLEQQGAKIEEMQLKVTLSMDSIGQVQQDQRMVKKALGGTALPPLVISTREEGGILAAPTRETTFQAIGRQELPAIPNPQVHFPPPTPVVAEVLEGNKGATER